MVIKMDPGLRVDGFPVGPVSRAVFKCVLPVVKEKNNDALWMKLALKGSFPVIAKTNSLRVLVSN